MDPNVKLISRLKDGKHALAQLKPKQRGALYLLLALVCVAGAFYALFTDKVDHYSAVGIGLLGFYGFYKLFGPGYDALFGAPEPGAKR